jgi:hypothetical protein
MPPAAGAPNVAASSDGSDAAAVLFPTEDELRMAPRQWRDRFGQIKQGYDALEKDHRDLKARAENWKGLENYGDPAAIQSELDVIRAFRNFRTDEKGNLQFDPVSGLPQYDVKPGIEMLAKQSPGMPARLFEELLHWPGETGQPFLREVFTELGLNPDHVEQYRKFSSGDLQIEGMESPGASRLNEVPEAYREAYKTLRPDVLKDFWNMPKETQAAILEDAKERFEDRQFKDSVKQWQAQQRQQEVDAFQRDLGASREAYVAELRQTTLDSIVNNLADQVQFSSDPTINAVQQGVVKATLASMLDPDLRFAIAPALEALGVQVEGLDQALAEAAQSAGLLKQYEAYGKHPSFAQYRDEYALKTAQQRTDAAVLQAKAKLNVVALKLAQALGGQMAARAEEIDTRLAAAKTRPVLSGPAGNGTTVQQGTKQGAPFSRERWAGYGLG